MVGLSAHSVTTQIGQPFPMVKLCLREHMVGEERTREPQGIILGVRYRDGLHDFCSASIGSNLRNADVLCAQEEEVL